MGGEKGTSRLKAKQTLLTHYAAARVSVSDFHSLLIAQRIFVTLQKENVWAIMRRRAERTDGVELGVADRLAVLQTDLWEG